MRPNLLVSVAITLLLTGCSEHFNKNGSEAEAPESWQLHLKTIAPGSMGEAVAGSRLYVPVYSHIYTDDRDRVLNLSETLSVRNTDSDSEIYLKSVKYQSTNGKLIRQYVKTPLILSPLAAAEFIVRLDDTSGGSGASFIIEWQAKSKVSPPLVEAVMISTGSGRNLSFVSRAVEMLPAKADSKPSATQPAAQTTGTHVITPIEANPTVSESSDQPKPASP